MNQRGNKLLDFDDVLKKRMPIHSTERCECGKISRTQSPSQRPLLPVRLSDGPFIQNPYRSSKIGAGEIGASFGQRCGKNGVGKGKRVVK